MIRMNRNAVLILFFLAISLPPFLVQAGELKGHKAAQGGPSDPIVFPVMPSPGTKVPIGNDHYLLYGFDKRPKLGTIIMKVEIFTRDGNRDTSFEVLADSGMPSMKGAHETGEQPFKVSNKGAYLLPVNIVMPGDWEIRFTIRKAGKVVFRGSHRFDV